jgi:hypothetical protein
MPAACVTPFCVERLIVGAIVGHEHESLRCRILKLLRARELTIRPANIAH